MSYKVIHYFNDLQDCNHPYEVGDVFPRLGMNVTDERLKELSGANNKQGRPLIEKVGETTVKADETSHNGYTKTEINRMSTADLKKLAISENVKNAEELNGADLKKVLIKKFGL